MDDNELDKVSNFGDRLSLYKVTKKELNLSGNF